MRLAVVTPLDPRTTGVADYSLELLPYLAEATGAPLEVFTDRDTDRSGPGWVAHPIGELHDRADHFDLILYQMGNSPAHDFMADDVLVTPGVVVLHDVSLHNFFARQIQAQHAARYWRALGYAYDVEGTAAGRRYWQNTVPIAYPRYLVSEWLAARSPGVIVHSQHAAQLLQSRCPAARVAAVPMPIPVPELPSKPEARQQLGLAPDAYVVLVFGVLNESKNPTAILEAARLLVDAQVPVQMVFMGTANGAFHLSTAAAEGGLTAQVIELGFVAELAVVGRWMAAADVAIGLRSIYWGETPSSTLRLLAAGLPAIVNDIGAFSELPDAACVKIAPGNPATAQTLFKALSDLYHDVEHRSGMSRAAREYIAYTHDPAETARRYLEFAEAVVCA